MANIDDVKTLLAISDDTQDSLLNVIVKNTEASLKVKLHLLTIDEIPEALNYIVVEVAVRRFNRVRNEAMSGYSQEGESITFKDNDFDDFLDDINAWLKDQDNKPKTLGSVSFISGYSGR